TTFATRQKAALKPAVATVPRRPVVTAPPRPVVRSAITAAPRPAVPIVTAPRSSALTPADRVRLSKLVPAIEEELGRLREDYYADLRYTCRHGSFSFDDSKLTQESDWDDDLLCESDDESDITIFDKADMVVRSRDSSSIDPSLSSFTYSNTALAQILADFSDGVFNNEATDDDYSVFLNDDTVIHHSLASSAYAHFVDPTNTDLELEEDVSMAALEELSYVEVSPIVHANLTFTSPPHSFANHEDDLVAALEQMDLADPVIGEGSHFVFSPLHSSFLSRHPSFLEDS
ncbi:unnamed protein product, partial [Aureobasidium uvarum]